MVVGFLVLLLGPQATDLTPAQSQIINEIRSTWKRLLPEDYKTETPRMVDTSGRLVHFSSKDDSGSFWKKTGILFNYRTGQGTQKALLGTGRTAQVSEDLIQAVAKATGHPSPVKIVFQQGGKYLVVPQFEGLPFLGQTLTITMNKNGWVSEIWNFSGDSYPAMPLSWNEDRQLPRDSAQAVAARDLASKIPFKEFEVLSTDLGFFYVDPKRWTSLPKRIDPVRNPDGTIGFWPGAVPGIGYTPPTAVCYKVRLRTAVDAETGSGAKTSDWWIFVDATTGETINLEMITDADEGLGMAKAKDPEPQDSKTVEAFQGGKWQAGVLAKTDKSTDKNGSRELVRKGKYIFIGSRSKDGRILVSIKGETLEFKFP